MTPLSIRTRLTGWYSALLAATLCLVCGGMFWAMKRSVKSAADEELRNRFQGAQTFMERLVPRQTTQELQGEFREHSGLRVGGDLLQVSDEHGNWLFRSQSIRALDIAPPSASQFESFSYKTIRIGGRPIRILSGPVQVNGRTFIVQLASDLTEFYAVAEKFQWIVISTIPAALLLASFGGYWMSGRALRPVDEITRTARSISAQNLSQRLSVHRSGDETARLSETLNEMFNRLETAFNRVTCFTADASHELRTPIALVRTTAELSLRKERSPHEYREALAQIVSETERTTALIENLLVLARTDAGAGGLSISKMDLVSVVADVCSQAQILAAARELVFHRRLTDADITVHGDIRALRQLFLILIDNAVKYTPKGGRVILSMERADGFAIIEIADSGIGIGPEDLPHIFERFYRADKARSRELGGAGLGLSIARWIADAHRSSIEVESTLAKGSLFRVRLPLSDLALPQILREPIASNLEVPST